MTSHNLSEPELRRLNEAKELRKVALTKDQLLDFCSSCGKKAASILVEISKRNPDRILHRVRCGGCDMQTGQYEDMDVAIKRWDTRV